MVDKAVQVAIGSKFQKIRKVKTSGRRSAEFRKQEAMAATTNTRSGGTMIY